RVRDTRESEGRGPPDHLGYLRLYEAVVHREDGELETREYAGLVEDAGQVVLDGVLAHAERFTDLLVRFARRDARDDLQLALRQPIAVRLRRRLFGCRRRSGTVGLHHLSRGVASEPELLLGHRADALEEERCGRSLQEHAARAELQCRRDGR